MALDINRYKEIEYSPEAMAIGKVGEDVVSSRLCAKGWNVKRLDKSEGNMNSGIVDFEIWKTDNSGKITDHALVEVKTRKSNVYKFTGIPCLTEKFSVCNAYDNYYKKRNLPLYLFWVCFYDKKIYCQEWRKIFEVRQKIDGILYPTVKEIADVETFFMPKQMFEFYNNITADEFKRWEQARGKPFKIEEKLPG